jgi:DNA-directed RNA polymerase subunit omega
LGLIILTKRGSTFPRKARQPIANLKIKPRHWNMDRASTLPLEQPKPVNRIPGTSMKSDLVEQASVIVSDPQVLINVVSQRVRQLNTGRAPLVETLPSMGAADIALTEIIEGKLKVIPGTFENLSE